MNSRERVLSSISHNKLDRIPVDLVTVGILMRIKLYIFLLATILLIFLNNAYAVINIYVDPSDGATVAPYTNLGEGADTIQDAIDAIFNANGDSNILADNVIIHVYTGNYDEAVTVSGYITSAVNDIVIREVSGEDVDLTGNYSRGINILDNNVTVEGFTVHDIYSSPTSGIGISVEGTNNLILNCTVYGCDLSGAPVARAGVEVKGGENTIKGCEIYDNNQGMVISGKNIYIISNTIYDNNFDLGRGMRLRSDDGGIYISYNEIYGHTGTAGILNNDTPNVHIYNNYIHHNTDGIRTIGSGNADTAFIYNNIIYAQTSDGIDLDDGDDDVKIINNTIYSNTGAAILANITANGQEALNNLITDNGGRAISDTANCNWTVCDYNLFYNNGLAHNVDDFGVNNIIDADNVNPSYLSTTPGADFLKIQSSSTCIDRGGTPSITINNDYWGDARPFNTLFDIGADEYVVLGCPIPGVTSFTPANGCQGAGLTINGSGFSNTGTVWIQDVQIAPGNISTWNKSQIQIIAIPAGITNGVIKISNTCGQVGYSISNFKTPGTMSITGFSPSSGCEGDTITIYGAGFGAVQDNGDGTPGSIWIDSWDATASNIYWSESMIQIIIGSAEPSGFIAVTNYCGNGVTSNPSNFAGCPPVGATISLNKFISNVSHGGSPAGGVFPGAAITYSIIYSNQGPADADMAIIYDILLNDVKYWEMDVIVGWSNEYTAAPSPNQAYISADYSNAPVGPSVNPAIQFIRWKRDSLPAGSSGILTYKVIIK